jgi:pimeloyl-ACP methyl ester carboxylesterase
VGARARTLSVELPQLSGVTHRDVEVNGVRIHVAEAGSGEPLILQHGWPQHWWAWRHMIPLLSPHYRLICPDLRGFGWSEAPARGYEKPQLARDLLGIFDVLELDRVRVVGHDWGAFAALLAAEQAPERFERLLVLNCPLPWQEPTLRKALTIWRFWYQFGLASGVGRIALQRWPRMIRRAIPTRAGNPGAWTRSDLDLFADVLREPARAAASEQLYRTFVTRELFAGMRERNPGVRLHVETKLLFGVDDVAISPVLLRGAERAADSLTIELVQNCGHFIAEEQPELVAQRAREFFG